MGHSLFKQIWNKAYKKTRTPKEMSKLVDDLGLMRGIFSYKKYDPLTGKILFMSENHNTLVNQSKSNLIRLISQGISSWRGTINPTDYKIQRMRFGTDTGNSPDRQNLYYYKLDEPSARSNQADNDFPGGVYVAGGLISGYSQPKDVITDALNASNYSVGPSGIVNGNSKIYPIPTLRDSLETYVNPPSHGTLIVKLYSEADELLEEIYFGEGVDDTDHPLYTRSTDGILPTKIISATETGLSTPNIARGVDLTLTNEEISLDPTLCGTRLFYDYTSTSPGWKIKLDLINNITTTAFDHIDIHFSRGEFNVVNSVVPKESAQIPANILAGTATTELMRYGGSYLDWYSVINSIEYRDSADDFIDDFSATFSVNMTGTYGNGDTDSGLSEYVRYSEAFLFNGLDDMFSVVSLPSPFDKNDTSAYYISWTILSPIG